MCLIWDLCNVQELNVSLLHVAVLLNHVRQTKLLLVNNADVNVTDAWVRS